jgi:hypothetical protein
MGEVLDEMERAATALGSETWTVLAQLNAEGWRRSQAAWEERLRTASPELRAKLQWLEGDRARGSGS